MNKIDQEHGYEIVVTVDLSGLKDFEQVEIEAANEVGTYSARLLCPKANSGPKAQSCSFFNVFTCPESSTYSQLALTVGVVLIIVFIVIGLILCYHISRQALQTIRTPFSRDRVGILNLSSPKHNI